MNKGINKVIIVGNLGSDPEVRYMQNDAAVAGFSVATSDGWKDKNTGEQHDRTRVVLFGKLAEVAEEIQETQQVEDVKGVLGKTQEKIKITYEQCKKLVQAGWISPLHNQARHSFI